MENLKINGIEKEFAAGIPATVTELLKQLHIEAATVVAEIDGQIVEQANFDKTALHKGQSIELIRFVPGG